MNKLKVVLADEDKQLIDCLDKNFKKNLEFFAQEKAKELAKEARERITNHYHSLIDRYYEDYEPKVDRHGVPYYIRTFGLYNSYREYYKNSHNSIYYYT